ncbi:btb (poz) domain-containing 2a-related [Anaeramoeba flamelloides]|uniref:Btb (Poz) domain-containing 2a-related n=1 Tax=Anaeramoeba flamelloides TaxID=1746091 RepID=A0ABQ8XH81_9EUKA|nr:btb (poz) domain-containing 2a-related [Anaeramoeba flamelloides]
MLNLEQANLRLLKTGKLSDLKFIIGKNKKEIKAHKLILGTSSQYWKSQLYNNEQLGRTNEGIDILIPSIEPKIFKRFLEYYYTRKPKLNETNIFQVFSATYVIKELQFRNFCLNYISNNSKQLLSKAEIFNVLKENVAQDLLEKCVWPNGLMILLYRRLLERAKFLSSKNQQETQTQPNNLSQFVKNLVPFIKIFQIPEKYYPEIDSGRLFSKKFTGLTQNQVRELQN